ncbi:MAG: flavodoxin-dependent (E)-4-hydroxy-3-methylbut-2-enyl-diphosphate synthase [Brevinematia bacterium]
MLKRRESRKIYLGKIAIGGDAPISIQSMTTFPTKEVAKVVSQIIRLKKVGCDIVRVGVPDLESAKAISSIKKEVDIPVVADIHFDHTLALESLKSGVDGLRINPGNLRNKDNVKEVVMACKERNVPIRIGVNSGSIDRKRYEKPTPEAMVNTAMEHIKILEELDFKNIKVSLKSSDVSTMIEANRIFANLTDYPLHLGVTEAGSYRESVVKSSIGIGSLLKDGIGDTIRVSITGDPVLEVEVAKLILRSLGLRMEGIEIISCPMCARKEFDVEKVVNFLQKKTKNIRKHIKVAVMGCVVNGPGEAMDADIGVAVGKTGAVLFENGIIVEKIDKRKIVRVLLDRIKA